MADAALRDQIRNYLVKERHLRKPPGDDDKLISGGIIDSFALVGLQMWIENDLGVTTVDQDMTAETMNTIAMIADYVESRRGK